MQPGRDLQAYIEHKAEMRKRHHVNLQPHVVVLCYDVSNISDAVYYAVIQNRVYYECRSLLEAVDICLKATFVFNLSYAPSAYSAWLYIQKAIYGICTPYDACRVKVASLLTDTR